MHDVDLPVLSHATHLCLLQLLFVLLQCLLISILHMHGALHLAAGTGQRDFQLCSLPLCCILQLVASPCTQAPRNHDVLHKTK